MMAERIIEVACYGNTREFEAQIYFRFVPGYPATRVDPGEADSVEIEKILIRMGDRWHPVDSQLHDMIVGLIHAEEDLLEEATGQLETALDDAAESRRDDRP